MHNRERIDTKRQVASALFMTFLGIGAMAVGAGIVITQEPGQAPEQASQSGDNDRPLPPIEAEYLAGMGAGAVGAALAGTGIKRLGWLVRGR